VMTNRKREATAYHEAGHAAIYCYLRMGFRKATIKPDKDYLGMVAIYRLGKRTIEELEYGRLARRHRERMENEIMCLLAGGIAEHIFTGRRNKIGAGSDHGKVLDFMMSACGSSEQAYAYTKWLETLTRDTLAKVVWPAVRRVAEALLEKETLNSKEVHAFYEEGLTARQNNEPRKRSARSYRCKD
jgi:ATP-dependent Zn protease